MPFKLTGGSVTLSVAILAAAVAIRLIRDSRRRRSSSSAPPKDSSSKYFCELSLEALALLAYLDAVPHYFIDVRSPEDAAEAPLAGWVSPAVNIPEPQLQTGLKQPAAWQSFAAAASQGVNHSSSRNTAVPAADSTQITDAAGNGSSPGGAAQQQQLPMPMRHHLLVVIADSGEQQQLAVSRAAAAGFDRVAVPSCGIEQLCDAALPGTDVSRDQQVLAAAAAAAVQFPVVHADALAALLGLVALPEGVWQVLNQQNPGLMGALNPADGPNQQQRGRLGCSPGHTRSNSGSGGVLAAVANDTAAADGAAAVRQQQQQQRLLLLDVRRHDERTLYGAIPGALHVPADELANALSSLVEPLAFRRRYHFEPPNRAQDVLVLHSRASSRAQWAAQICLDAGCKYVFVYPEGVLGWSFTPGVEAYTAYQQGDKPPEPEARTLREPDAATGVMELQQLGLVPLLMQQHGRTA